MSRRDLFICAALAVAFVAALIGYDTWSADCPDGGDGCEIVEATP